MPVSIHGTPITPKRLLQQLRGSSFCVSFLRPEQLDDVLELQNPAGMLMLDNGAFTHWRAGNGRIDRAAFFEWANRVQSYCDVAVAVIPDVIGGSEDENWMEAARAVRDLSDFPERLAFVWHMNDSMEQLKRACVLFNFVAIGSCADFDIQTKRGAYVERLRHASAVIDYVERFHQRRPWIHLMRGLSVLCGAVRFDSADSSNIARNHNRTKGQEHHVAAMARRIDDPITHASTSGRRGRAYPTTNFSEG